MWQDEIKDATYTSPSGKSFSFTYGTGLTKETDLKTATFTFPEVDGALVDSLGVGGRRFPLVCTFFGADCFSLADSFEAGLCERGYGELQHPIYGVHKVVPTGTIERTDNLSTELNYSSVKVVFAETIIDKTFPASKVVTQDLIDSAMEKFSNSAVVEFASDLDLGNVFNVITIQGTLKEQVRGLSDNVSETAKKSVSTWTRFQQVLEGVGGDINDIVNKAVEYGEKVVTLCRLPSKLAVGVLGKVESYGSTIRDLINTYKRDPVGLVAVKNQFVATRLMVQSLVASLTSGVASAMAGGGTVDSASGGSVGGNNAAFRSRDEVINTVLELIDLYENTVDFCDNKISKDLFVDVGLGYDAMQEVVINSLQMIVNFSFDLPSKKVLTLGRDRQVIELVAELYGGFDRLDEFIVDNNLTYDEIAVIPMGRQVVYYG